MRIKIKEKIDDLKPFEHGQEGTHYACNRRMKEEGSKTKCCGCTPCKYCNQVKDWDRDWRKDFNKEFGWMICRREYGKCTCLYINHHNVRSGSLEVENFIFSLLVKILAEMETCGSERECRWVLKEYLLDKKQHD